MHRVLLSTPWRARIKRTRPQVRISNTFPPCSGWQEHLTRDMLIYNNCIQICKTRKTAHTHNQLIIFNYGYRPENGHISKDLQEDLCISCNYLKQFKVIPRGCPTQICHATEEKDIQAKLINAHTQRSSAASCILYPGDTQAFVNLNSRYPYTFHAYSGNASIHQFEQQNIGISCIPGWAAGTHSQSMHTVDYQTFATLDSGI